MKKACSAWRNVIHYSFICIFLVLIVVLPVLYTQLKTLPYWVIYMIFGLWILLYSIYWMLSRKYNKTDNVSLATTDNTTHTTINMENDEVAYLNYEAETDDSIIETSYNPSTVGIPPSSFLAPTINQQASIRSSSLDYTPPPPAYHHDLMYPPSYRSTSSTKDYDSQSAVVY